MPDPIPLGEGLYLLDLLFQGAPGVIASYLLVGPGDDLALIEVGPGSTVPALLEGIRAAGCDPRRVKKLIVTHIHLDHAGAAGLLLQDMPDAQFYVHEVGAPHMIDPSKLLASAQRIYGDQMDPLWGAFLPVPADRLVVLKDGDTLAAGGRTLEVLYTPGHASHHVALYDRSQGGHLFTGDVAGVRLQGYNYVRPPTPPPDLDPARWNASIDRFLALDPLPSALYLTHFGPFTDTPRHLHELRTRLQIWGDILHTAMRAGETREQLIRTLETAAGPALRMQADADGVARYDLAGNNEMSVDGFIRYLRKTDPALAGWGK